MKKFKHIVIVDQSSLYRKALKKAIKTTDSNIIMDAEFDKCTEILNYLKNNLVDILFIEINLSNNALNIIEQIASEQRKIKIVAMSSFEFDFLIESVKEKGAFAFISKCRNNFNLLKQILSTQNNRFLINNELQ